MLKKEQGKRVNIVSVKLVRDSSLIYEKRRIKGPTDAKDIAKPFLTDCDREKFILICLNTKNEPTTISTISIGSLNSTLVHPREVFKVAIMANASSIIISHNHPSGDPEPSKEDIALTRRLNDAANILGITLTDHIIIGSDDRFVSFKEMSLI